MLDVSLTISIYVSEHSEGLKYLVCVFCWILSQNLKSTKVLLEKSSKRMQKLY